MRYRRVKIIRNQSEWSKMKLRHLLSKDHFLSIAQLLDLCSAVLVQESSFRAFDCPQ